ncbi:hypothetical protein L1987_78070 [Smallanthus sonchifolius]|uniref:Uncharacterized protein n=1 Tax=Smallanthus sonchifolius TaxID=185202 RepID=A0ACB8ZBV5_9ASTR|nr:hypothetical protein L1987_78070 [Smallanthus sonchifolius]
MDSLEEGEISRGDNGPAWQQQGRRVKNRGLGVEISFFVSNLPGGVSQEEVRRAFNVHGAVTRVYVARKKTANGCPFGFVRFRDVSDAWWLERRPDKMKLGSNVLRVNIAKFAKSNEFLFQRQAPPRPESTVREGPKSHADTFMGAGRSFRDALLIGSSRKTVVSPATVDVDLTEKLMSDVLLKRLPLSQSGLFTEVHGTVQIGKLVGADLDGFQSLVEEVIVDDGVDP